MRGNALLGFGHLARTAGAIREPDDVRALVEAGLADPTLTSPARPKRPLATSNTFWGGS
ncbi:MAG: hypothetical protein Q8R02_16705 [Hyphomonadaceae bacterium]|nr:hypothetical protein [Hyphomonadaceae bacterium]